MLCKGKLHRQLATCLPTAVLSIGALVSAGCYQVCCDTCTLGTSNHAFPVHVEHGTRRTTAGDQVAYSLFMPQPSESLAAPPYPAVVISHGFARSKRFHANTACALAERGIVVLTPDLISLLGGEEAQQRNIENLVDHVRWLRTRATAESDPLFDLLDPGRIGLVGHSAGVAISLEAAIELNEAGESVDALMLLDGVPWARTVDRAEELRELAFASVRSEPSACNAEGAIRDVLARLPFATEDILVVGGSHCDPENPTDLLCRLACGGSNEQARGAYQELIGAFLGDALAAPDMGSTGIHWGNRFVLVLYPLLALLAAEQGMAMVRSSDGIKSLASILAGLLLVVSLAAQIYSCTLIARKKDFNRRLTDTVAARSEGAVVTDVWWVPQALSRIFYEKQFFYAPSQALLQDLGRRLLAENVSSVLFVTSANNRPPATNTSRVDDNGLGFFTLDVVPLELSTGNR